MTISETLISHLKTTVGIFEETETPYALAGGLAFSALVEPRATIDIDLLILFREDKMERLFGIMKNRFDSLIVHESPMRFNRINIWRSVIITNGQEFILDFLLGESEFHKSALDRAMAVEFFDTRVHIVTIEDLVILKKHAGRPQDKVDIRSIYDVFETMIDHDYIEYWSA